MSESGVRGLLANSDAGIVEFFKLVQGEASRLGKVFFIADAEGNDARIGSLHAEDMSGWLVPEGRADEFEAIWRSDQDALWDAADDLFVWVRWRRGADNSVLIEFTG